MTIRAVLALVALSASVATAQTQSAMNQRAARSASRADSTLNALYHRLETTYRSDSVALGKLQAAQLAWRAFRDAQVDATYSAVDRARVYGSVLPMCISALLEELTKARIAQLQRAHRPTEGDLCSGGIG